MYRTSSKSVRALLLTSLLAMGACSGIDAPNLPASGDGTANASPRAVAGHGGEYAVGHEVQLDGSMSFDVDGEIQSYAWTMVTAPLGAESFEASDSPASSYYLSTEGDYVFHLTVTDDQGATNAVLVEVQAVIHDPVLINIAGTSRIELGQELPLVATLDVGDATNVALAWSVVAQPNGATVVIDEAATTTPTFHLDGIGKYRAQLAAETPWASYSATKDIFVTADQKILLHLPQAAQYSSALDRLIYRSLDAVIFEGQHIHILDMETDTEELVPAFFPFDFDISPDGTQIAFNHRAPGSNVRNAISVADILTPDQQQSFVVVFDMLPTILSSTRVLLKGAPELRGLDPTTGAITNELEGVPSSAIRRANTQPATIYSFINSSQDDDGINTIDATVSPMQLLTTSSSVGTLAVCGNLWPSEDGEFVITGCGEVLQASTDPRLHLTNLAALPITQIRHISHGTASGRIAVIHGPFQDLKIELFDDSTFTSLGIVNVPPILHTDPTDDFSTLFPLGAFFGPDETELYVIGRYSYPTLSDSYGGVLRIPID